MRSVVAKNRTEQRHLADVMSPAKVSNPILWHVNVLSDHDPTRCKRLQTPSWLIATPHLSALNSRQVRSDRTAVATISRTIATTRSGDTFRASPVLRTCRSTVPSARPFLPTTIRSGNPTKSASLNQIGLASRVKDHFDAAASTRRALHRKRRDRLIATSALSET